MLSGNHVLTSVYYWLQCRERKQNVLLSVKKNILIYSYNLYDYTWHIEQIIQVKSTYCQMAEEVVCIYDISLNGFLN